MMPLFGGAKAYPEAGNICPHTTDAANFQQARVCRRRRQLGAVGVSLALAHEAPAAATQHHGGSEPDCWPALAR
jgi:hypothetical protein